MAIRDLRFYKMMYPFFFFGYGGITMLVLRIALGAIFIAHGWSKVSDLKKNAEGFGGMGFRPGAFWGTIAALLEFFGGIAFLLGIFTVWLAFLFAIEFAVILIWRIAKGHPFIHGWELDLLVFAAILLFLSAGAGHLLPGGTLSWGY